MIAGGSAFISFSILALARRTDHPSRSPSGPFAWRISNQRQHDEMETNMKTTLILSTLVAALSIVSTASFAQNFVNWTSAYGNSHPTITVAPTVGRLTASDFDSASAPRMRHYHTPGR